MTDKTLEEIAAEARAHPGVSSAKVWNNRRVYVSFVGFDGSFAGCRSLKVYYDKDLGWTKDKHKGFAPEKFSENARAFAESVNLDYRGYRI